MINVKLFINLEMEYKIKEQEIKNYISIGDEEMIINKNNKLQFSYGYKGFSKEYNIPKNLETYLKKNVWNIKNILQKYIF